MSLQIPDVGPWTEEKHGRIRRYVTITKGVRKKWNPSHRSGATYIDLYGGPGKAIERESNKLIDGSPVVAMRTSIDVQAHFNEFHLADTRADYIESLRESLPRNDETRVFTYQGPATQTVDQVCQNLDPTALHFAFLDPYNLKDLNFEVICKLGQFANIDLLMHVSAQELQRNLERYIEGKTTPLDSFAPGWRDAISNPVASPQVRREVIRYWVKEVEKHTGLKIAERFELVTAQGNQPLYWLVFAAKHSRAHEFWNKIRNISGQGELGF